MSVWIAARSPASGRGGRPRRRGAVLCQDERCGRETPRAAATALTGRPPATRSRARAAFWGRSRARPLRAGSRAADAKPQTRKPVLFEHNSINKRANAGRAFMQRHRSQPVHGPLFSALEQEHNVVLSASTSPMMRGEDLMVWEPEQEWVLNGLLDRRRAADGAVRRHRADRVEHVVPAAPATLLPLSASSASWRN